MATRITLAEPERVLESLAAAEERLVVERRREMPIARWKLTLLRKRRAARAEHHLRWPAIDAEPRS